MFSLCFMISVNGVSTRVMHPLIYPIYLDPSSIQLFKKHDFFSKPNI